MKLIKIELELRVDGEMTPQEWHDLGENYDKNVERFIAVRLGHKCSGYTSHMKIEELLRIGSKQF